MQTVYKEDLKEEIYLRKKELQNLLIEKEGLDPNPNNPFDNKKRSELNEVITECLHEIRSLRKNIRNKSF